MRKTVGKNRFGFVAAVASSIWFTPAGAQNVIKIGDVGSYSNFANHFGQYKNGMDLALEEVNSSGGINGKHLVVLTRDDKANAGEAIRAAEDLVSREGVRALTGTILSSVAIALNDFAKQNKVMFFASMSLSDRMVWQDGSRYGFRLRPGTYSEAAVTAEKAAQLGKKRWAIVYPNYEFGQLVVKNFKRMLKEKQPDVEFVAEQGVPLGKIDASPVVQSILDARPDAIISVLFASDMVKFVRAGTTQGLFDGRDVIGIFTGEPENLELAEHDPPLGWWVTGYPRSDIRTSVHETFLQAYRKRFGKEPGISSVVGYTTIKTLAAAFKRAGKEDTEALVDAMPGLTVDTPLGSIQFRGADNTSNMGVFIGRIVESNGKPAMVESEYKQGGNYLPSETMVKEFRQSSK